MTQSHPISSNFSCNLKRTDLKKTPRFSPARWTASKFYLSAISCNFIQFSSIFINFLQFSSIFSSKFPNFAQFSSISLNLPQFSSIFINFFQFSSVFLNFSSLSNLIQFEFINFRRSRKWKSNFRNFSKQLLLSSNYYDIFNSDVKASLPALTFIISRGDVSLFSG